MPPLETDTKQDDNGDEMPNRSAETAQSRVVRGTLLTVFFRVLSFGCTQFTLRRLDPATLGKTAVQLEVFHSTIVFVSREGFRLALTRPSTETTTTSTTAATTAVSPKPPIGPEWNVAWLTIPVTTLITSLAIVRHEVSYWSSGLDQSNLDEDYRVAGWLYAISACIEGWAEPAILYTLRECDTSTKASAEGISGLLKTATALLLLSNTAIGQDWPAMAVGAAHVMYAIVYAMFLYAQTWKHLSIPSWTRDAFDGQTCYMTAVFTVQGLFKHMLTEGDRIVLVMLSQSYDQGIYAMGSAYGGLAARMILQPLEENARLLWSRLASLETSTPLLESYTLLVKIVLYIGLIFGCLAVNYTGLLLHILAGRSWGGNEEAAQILSAFCVYTAFLAANGMTEAFCYATASTSIELGRLGIAHTIVGVVFALAAALAVSWYGTLGVVVANCLAMMLRAMYAVYYAAAYFFEKQTTSSKKSSAEGVEMSLLQILRHLVMRMLPHRLVALSFIASYMATRASLERFQALTVMADSDTPLSGRVWLQLAAQHVAVGATCGIGVLTLAYLVENDLRSSLHSILHRKRD